MKILVINAGSSSMKYQLIDMENENVIAKGLCERIGIDGKITHKTFEGKEVSVEGLEGTGLRTYSFILELPEELNEEDIISMVPYKSSIKPCL